MTTEKRISYQIEQQFPAIYRESGRELVDLVKEYYKFQETDPNQGLYNSRRMFEYRDIDTTLNNMLLFFNRAFLDDLPFNEKNTRFIVKNILDLYRRRGTQEGLELFFQLFFQEEITVYYPARDILKPSHSNWTRGIYIQMFPNDNIFTSETGKQYDYGDIIGRTVSGSISKAISVVDKINFLVLNKSKIPVLYLDDMSGSFVGFDELLCSIDGEIVNFGTVYGAMNSVFVDLDFNGTTGNKIGDKLNVVSDYGVGGVVEVSDTTTTFSGQISYEVEEGGFGFSKENTRLLVSDQVLFLPNRDLQFDILETLQDQFGNSGIITGQGINSVGVKMDTGDEFSLSSVITKYDSESNTSIEITGINRITSKNTSSPGPLFPDVGGPLSVKLDEIENPETIQIITDVIGNFLDVPLDSSDYNTIPPALTAMSGNTTPTTISTPLSDAFDLSGYTIGTIKRFINIDPGEDYDTDVFAVAIDEIIRQFEKRDQVLVLSSSATNLKVGGIITQGSKRGKIKAVSDSVVTVIPYSFSGFDKDQNVVYEGQEFDVLGISLDYTSRPLGINSVISTNTDFGIGKITNVAVSDSGFGYIDGSEAFLTDNEGNIEARGTIRARSQGKTAGFWTNFNSHLNGYTQTVANEGTDQYFNSGKFIQDSDFYQEYSYQIKSQLNINEYSDLVKDNIQVAGTKLFGELDINQKYDVSTSARSSISLVVDRKEKAADCSTEISELRVLILRDNP